MLKLGHCLLFGIVDLFLLVLEQLLLSGSIGSVYCCRYQKPMFGIGVAVVGNGSSFCWGYWALKLGMDILLLKLGAVVV